MKGEGQTQTHIYMCQLTHIELHQLGSSSRGCHCCLIVPHFRIQITNDCRLSKDALDTILLVPYTSYTQLSPMSSSSSSSTNKINNNPPPACLSRAQVAELRMAVALVVIRQRQTKRLRQQQQQQQDNHDNTNSTVTALLEEAPRQRRCRQQEQDNNAIGATMIHNSNNNTATTRSHVHHLMEIAVTQSLLQQQQQAPTTGLMLHLSQMWQMWIARDGPQPAAALLNQLWQGTHTTSRMVALCSVYQTMVGLSLLQNNNNHGNHGLVHVLEQSIRGVLSAHGALGAGQNNKDDDDEFDRLFLMISLWEFCLEQQPTPLESLQNDDTALPATGLLPADLHRQWKAAAAAAGSNNAVNALWIRHTVGMARQRSAAPQYQRATTTTATTK